jgi:hypothetical protein
VQNWLWIIWYSSTSSLVVEDELIAMLKPSPDEALKIWPVDKASIVGAGLVFYPAARPLKQSDRLLGHKFGIGYQLRAPGCYKEAHGHLEFGESGQMKLRMPND